MPRIVSYSMFGGKLWLSFRLNDYDHLKHPRFGRSKETAELRSAYAEG